MATIWLLGTVLKPNDETAVICSTVSTAAAFLMEAIIWQLRHGKWDIDLKVGMVPAQQMGLEKQEKEWPQ